MSEDNKNNIIQPGCRIELEGKTKYGKECEDRQDYTWIVVKIKTGFDLGKEDRQKKYALLRAENRPDVHWRWVALKEDDNFTMREKEDARGQ